MRALDQKRFINREETKEVVMRRPPQTAILSITFVCTIVVLGWNFAEQARRSALWRQQLVLPYSAMFRRREYVGQCSMRQVETACGRLHPWTSASVILLPSLTPT